MGVPVRDASGLPNLPPEEFRAAAIRYMARDLGVGEASARYTALVAGAADALACSLTTLREDFPDVAFDFTESSLDALDAALRRRTQRAPSVAKRSGSTIPEEVVTGVGAYLGEVLRIHLRGSWLVRFDPAGGRGFRASTIHFDPGLARHGGFEADVFRVAESVRRVNGERHHLRDHLRFARSLMDHPETAPRKWNGSCCRPAQPRRASRS